MLGAHLSRLKQHSERHLRQKRAEAKVGSGLFKTFP